MVRWLTQQGYEASSLQTAYGDTDDSEASAESDAPKAVETDADTIS